MKIFQSTEAVIAMVLVLVMIIIGLVNPAFWGSAICSAWRNPMS